MTSDSPKGFALVAAVLALMVLTAVGLLVFTSSTQDIRVSGRLIGEKRAFSAAEAGVHYLTITLDPANLVAVPLRPIDGTSQSQYSITQPVKPNSGPAFLPLTGYSIEGGKQWGLERFNARVTGTNTAYESHVELDVGVGFGPVSYDTNYPG